ncbi:hypothetical protein Tco_1267129, partial [Tanacetum coccineum]
LVYALLYATYHSTGSSKVDQADLESGIALHIRIPGSRKVDQVDQAKWTKLETIIFSFPVDFIDLDMPEDIRVPLILGRPFLSTACAKIDVYKRKFTLRVREEKSIFKSVKPTSSIIKRVYMLSLKERMDLDLEARLIGESLVLNRSLDPFLEDYIELNDLNEPFKLRRNQGNDLMPTIEEGDDEVTYQMVRSHLRFKHHTNEQCNKIPPLLKVNEKDVMNEGLLIPKALGVHTTGVLNIGPITFVLRRQKNGSHCWAHERKWVRLKREADRKV